MIRFLDLKAQYHSIKTEIDAAIQSVIEESAFVGGRYVETFEHEFAAYQQCKYCVGVGNGTDALEIAIEALGLEPGSDIIVPANSFIASAEAVTRSGHKVVFCDCDEHNSTISVNSLRQAITANTRAVIAVHLYGHPCDMDAVLEIAQTNGLKVIEDCAQAHGAEYKGKRVGGIGDISAFSFYPGKNLGAYGDAGAILTNSEALSRKCRMISNHGRIEKYNHEFEGRNSRLDGLQAAILSVKLRHLDQWLDTRIKLANRYFEELSGVDSLILPVRETWAKHVFHLFVVRVQNRDFFIKYLHDHGINTGIHYPISLPKLKAYDYIDNSIVPVATGIDNLIASLPIGEHLTCEAIDFVCEKIKAMPCQP